MPLTGEMLNAQGNATCREEKPSISPKYLSLGKTEKEVVPEASTAGHKIKKTSHGLVTGNVVVLGELNGKTKLGEEEGGLVVGASYYVHEVSSSEFALAMTKAQAESATEAEWVAFTVEVKTTSKLAKVIEANVKARVATSFGSAANGANEDTTAHEVESEEAAQKIKWFLYYSASTSGTLTLVEAATEKELAKGDIYKVTKTTLAQTAYVV